MVIISKRYKKYKFTNIEGRKIRMESYWIKSTKKKEFESLNDDIITDILVIGGGLTGI